MSVRNDGTIGATSNKFRTGYAANPCEIIPVSITKGDMLSTFLPFNWTSGVIYDLFIITSSGKQFPYRAQAI